MSFVNIVILVRDRFRLTEQMLTTLQATTTRDKYRLLIVDDGSEDFRTMKLLSGLTRDTVIQVQGSGHRVGKLKSLGVRASEILHGRGDWLYIGDGDTAFLPDWLTLMIGTAERLDEHYGGCLLGGQVHPFHHPVGELRDNQMKIVCPELAVLDGPSWLMRWATWDEIGPLIGEAPGPCQSEDAEWCSRLRRAGGRIGVTVPYCVVHTGLTQTNGQDAPGRADREKTKVQGVLYE